jgi:hypothetical protein
MANVLFSSYVLYAGLYFAAALLTGTVLGKMLKGSSEGDVLDAVHPVESPEPESLLTTPVPSCVALETVR